MKIFAQKGRTLTQAEILELAGLLVKAGYQVKLSRAKIENKVVTAVEFTGDGGTEDS